MLKRIVAQSVPKPRKKRLGRLAALTIAACMLVNLIPVSALADGGDAGLTIDGKNIYANGVPIVLTEGSDPALTVICDSDGVPFTIDGLPDNQAEGSDLTSYNIYGGTKSGDVSGASVTLEGGRVSSLYAGCNQGNVTGDCTLTITGGNVHSLAWGGSSASGTAARSTVIMTGGTVDSQLVAGKATESASVTVTGGRVNTCIRSVGGGDNAAATLTLGGAVSIGGFELEGVWLNSAGKSGGFDRIAIADGGFTGPAAVCVSLPADFTGEFAENAAEGDERNFILCGDGAAGKAAIYAGGQIEVRETALETDGEGRYLVSSEADLCFLRDQVNCKGTIAPGVPAAAAGYLQTAPLDLSGVNWMPIGVNKKSSNSVNYASAAPFGGAYDGGEQTIAHLTVDWPQLYGAGLFGLHDAGESNVILQNLALEDCDVTGYGSVGAILGGGDIYKPANGPSLVNCRATGRVTAASPCAGGLAGQAARVAMTDCTAEVSVRGAQICGGLIGASGYAVRLENCRATGDVTAIRSTTGGSAGLNADAGGLAGSLSKGSNGDGLVTGCTATGDVTAYAGDSDDPRDSTCNTGGLIGQARNIDITECNASGDVSGEQCVGGLAGLLGGASRLSASYATGNVNAATGNAGGLVGEEEYDTEIMNCYASGDISGYAYNMGGLAGQAAGKIQNCYALGDVAAEDWNAGGIVGYGESATVENCAALGSVTSQYYKAGGIAGTGGTIRNCAALNPFVSSAGDSGEDQGAVGRISGAVTGRTTLEGNFAFSGMKMITDGSSSVPSDGAADSRHGEGKPANLCLKEESYPAEAGWSAERGWTLQPGGNENLPFSLSVFSRIATPEHLKLPAPAPSLGVPKDIKTSSAALVWSVASQGESYRVRLEYRAAGEADWSVALQDTDYSADTGVQETPLTALTPGTEYEVRLSVFYGTDGKAEQFCRFRTPALTPDTGAIDVEVSGPDGNALAVTASIEAGNTVIASQSGSATNTSPFSVRFSTLPDGFYNIVVRTADYMETRLAEVKNGQTTETHIFSIPSGALASVVEIQTPDTPKLAVDGLKQIITDQEKADAARGTSSTEVRLTVRRQEENGDDAEQSTIKGLAGDRSISDFLELSLYKTTTDLSTGQPATSDIGGSNDVVLEIAIPYDTARRGIAVYRYHGAGAEALARLDARPDGAFSDGAYFVGGGYLFVYSKAFSTFAIAYDKPSGASSGGSSATYYTLTATAGEGGAISPDGSVRVRRNDSKTFTITPEDGWEIADVLVDGKSVGAVKTYVFDKVARAHTIAASFRAREEQAAWNPFTDVDESDWFYDGIKYAYESGLMRGTSATAFSPYMDTTRGMIITILWKSEQSPESGAAMTFTDVPEGSCYCEAVRWAAERKIVKGYDALTFGPGNPITRQELASILYHYSLYKGRDVSAADDLSRFTDKPDPWAEASMRWAVGAGIFAGKGGGILDPRGPASRAEAASILAAMARKQRI